MEALFYAHSGLRYLVLLAGIVALLFFAYALATHRPAGRGGRIATAAFTGLLDLQIVLGLILMASGIYYGALIGHMVMMLLAAVVAHGASAMARRAGDARREYTIRLVGVLGALVLIAGGIMSIGRSLFGSGAPTLL